MENAKKFFEEAIRTEEAKNILASCEKPATEEETFKIYSDVAAKLGIELSEEEIKTYFAEKAGSGELDDNELSQLSGGGDHTGCKDSYKDKENCWWDDACDLINSKYEEYECKINLKGASIFYQWDM